MIGYVIVGIAGFTTGVGVSFALMRYYQKNMLKKVQEMIKTTDMSDIFASASKSSEEINSGGVLSDDVRKSSEIDSRTPADIKDEIRAINEAFNDDPNRNEGFNDDAGDDDYTPLPKLPVDKKDLETLNKTISSRGCDSMPVIDRQVIDAICEKRVDDLIGEMLKDQTKPGRKMQKKRNKKDFRINFKRGGA